MTLFRKLREATPRLAKTTHKLQAPLRPPDHDPCWVLRGTTLRVFSFSLSLSLLARTRPVCNFACWAPAIQYRLSGALPRLRCQCCCCAHIKPQPTGAPIRKSVRTFNTSEDPSLAARASVLPPVVCVCCVAVGRSIFRGYFFAPPRLPSAATSSSVLPLSPSLSSPAQS